MAKRWIVTALGKDQPGIVAGVTEALYKLGCNLEASAMNRLAGEFAIMLIFSAKDSLSAEQLCRAYAPLERRLGLVVHLKALSKQEAVAKKRGRPYMISVYGSDKPGIVYKVADLLSRARVNVTDLHTHRSAGKAPSLYLMLLEIEIPQKTSIPALEKRLRALGAAMGVRVNLRASDTNIL